MDCRWGCRVCFGAWSRWQGGACCCTSASELNNLCGISTEVGAGRRRSGGRALCATTSCRTQKESHLCYVMAARALHPSLSIPLLPSKTPPPNLCLSLACASLLWVGFTENGLDSVFTASFFVCLVTVEEKRGVSSCTFHRLKLKMSFSIAAAPPPTFFSVTFLSPPTIVTSDCPQTALDWQLHVCTRPSHLMFTFAPWKPDEDNQWPAIKYMGAPLTALFLSNWKSKFKFDVRGSDD